MMWCLEGCGDTAAVAQKECEDAVAEAEKELAAVAAALAACAQSSDVSNAKACQCAAYTKIDKLFSAATDKCASNADEKKAIQTGLDKISMAKTAACTTSALLARTEVLPA